MPKQSKNLLRKKIEWVIFDIDGVLIDTNGSFDECVARTVKHFTKNNNDLPGFAEIKLMRRIGEFGDDFKLAEFFIILIQNGFHEFNPKKIPLSLEKLKEKYDTHILRKEIMSVFNSFYIGKSGSGAFENEGLWKREKGNVSQKLLKLIKQKYKTGIITGRDTTEAKLAMKIIGIDFENIITRECGLKPNPDLLYSLVGKTSAGVYLGDTENDKKFVASYNKKFRENFGFIFIDKKNKVNNILKILLSNNCF